MYTFLSVPLARTGYWYYSLTIVTQDCTQLAEELDIVEMAFSFFFTHFISSGFSASLDFCACESLRNTVQLLHAWLAAIHTIACMQCTYGSRTLVIGWIWLVFTSLRTQLLLCLNHIPKQAFSLPSIQLFITAMFMNCSNNHTVGHIHHVTSCACNMCMQNTDTQFNAK